jgi:hypothetical protein
MRSLFLVAAGLLMCAGCAKQSDPRVERGAVTAKPQRAACAQPYLTQVLDEYHVVVFGYNGRGGQLNPGKSHTFASWVHTRDRKVCEQIDISWMPETDRVRVAEREIPGHNKCLSETMADATGCNVRYWLLRTDKSFFDAAAAQRDRLAVYKALDGKSRPDAVNCIHACSDIAGPLSTGAKNGIAASQEVADLYVREGRAWPCGDEWLMPLLLKTSCGLEMK